MLDSRDSSTDPRIIRDVLVLIERDIEIRPHEDDLPFEFSLSEVPNALLRHRHHSSHSPANNGAGLASDMDCKQGVRSGASEAQTADGGPEGDGGAGKGEVSGEWLAAGGGGGGGGGEEGEGGRRCGGGGHGVRMDEGRARVCGEGEGWRMMRRVWIYGGEGIGLIGEERSRVRESCDGFHEWFLFCGSI